MKLRATYGFIFMQIKLMFIRLKGFAQRLTSLETEARGNSEMAYLYLKTEHMNNKIEHLLTWCSSYLSGKLLLLEQDTLPWS